MEEEWNAQGRVFPVVGHAGFAQNADPGRNFFSKPRFRRQVGGL